MNWKEQFNGLMNSDYFNYDIGYREQIKDFIQTKIREAYIAGQENGIKRGKERLAKLIDEIPDTNVVSKPGNGFNSISITKLKQQLKDKWL